MPKRRPTKAQRNMRKRRTADPATQAWIASWPIERRTSQVTASKSFYGIPIDLQVMIFEYALEIHEPDTIVVSVSLINDAYYVYSDGSSAARKGSRALLEVNVLSRELALRKFSGSLRNLPVPFPALCNDPTPVLSTFRFDPVNDVIHIAPFYYMAIRMFPGLALALSNGQGRASDDLEQALCENGRIEWNVRLQVTTEFEFLDNQPMNESRLLEYHQQLWKLSSIQNMRINFEDLHILLSMNTRPPFEQAVHKAGIIVNFLLSNRSLKKLIIMKPFELATSREGRRRTKMGDAWVLDFTRENERRLQERAMADAQELGIQLTPEQLDHVQAKDLTGCILFILSDGAVDL